MKNICKTIISLYILTLFLNFIGCTPVPVKSIPSSTSIPVITEADKKDSIDILIEGIDSKPVTPTEKMVGYVNVEVLEVFPTPKKTIAINHILRGQKVFIFNTNGDWANISADETYEYWIDLKYICFIQNCWVNNNISKNINNLDRNNKTYQKKNIVKSNVYPFTSYNGKGYINTKGNYVPSPRKSNKQPNGATAKCRDGSWSFSQSRRGTCSGHGGVSSWL